VTAQLLIVAAACVCQLEVHSVAVLAERRELQFLLVGLQQTRETMKVMCRADEGH
jgi:hypothetical protein